MFDLRDVLIKIRTTLDRGSLQKTEKDLAQSMKKGLSQIDIKKGGNLDSLNKEAKQTSASVQRSFSSMFKSMVNEGRSAMRSLSNEMKRFAKDEGGWLNPDAFRRRKLPPDVGISGSAEYARQQALKKQIKDRLASSRMEDDLSKFRPLAHLSGKEERLRDIKEGRKFSDSYLKNALRERRTLMSDVDPDTLAGQVMRMELDRKVRKLRDARREDLGLHKSGMSWQSDWGLYQDEASLKKQIRSRLGDKSRPLANLAAREAQMRAGSNAASDRARKQAIDIAALKDLQQAQREDMERQRKAREEKLKIEEQDRRAVAAEEKRMREHRASRGVRKVRGAFEPPAPYRSKYELQQGLRTRDLRKQPLDAEEIERLRDKSINRADKEMRNRSPLGHLADVENFLKSGEKFDRQKTKKEGDDILAALKKRGIDPNNTAKAERIVDHLLARGRKKPRADVEDPVNSKLPPPKWKIEATRERLLQSWDKREMDQAGGKFDRPLRELATAERNLKAGHRPQDMRSWINKFLKGEEGFLDVNALRTGVRNMFNRVVARAGKIVDSVVSKPANVAGFGRLINDRIPAAAQRVRGFFSSKTVDKASASIQKEMDARPSMFGGGTGQPAGVQAFGNFLDRVRTARPTLQPLFNLYDKWFANRPRTDSAISQFASMIRGGGKPAPKGPDTGYTKPTIASIPMPMGVEAAIRLTREKEAQLRIAKQQQTAAKDELSAVREILKTTKELLRQKEAIAKKHPTQTNKNAVKRLEPLVAGAEEVEDRNVQKVLAANQNVTIATNQLTAAKAAVASAVAHIVGSTASIGTKWKASFASATSAFTTWTSSVLGRASAFGKKLALGLALGATGAAKGLLTGLGAVASPVGSLFSGILHQAKMFVGYLGLYLGGRALYNFARNSVGAFAEFDLAMARSMALMSDVDQAMRGKLEARARSLAKTWNIEFVDAANSIRFLAQSGFNAAQAFEALPIVLKFSKASLVDSAKASDLLTTSQAALGLKVLDATANMQLMTKVSDVLTRASVDVEGSMEQIAEALTHKAGAAARVYRRDVEETVAVLEAFHRQGIKGSLAGEQFAIFLREISRAAAENSAVWKHYKVEVFDVNKNMRPLADIIEDLSVLFGRLNDEGQTQVTQQLGLTFRSVHATRALLGMSDAIRQFEKNNRSAMGFTERVAGRNMDAFSERWGRIQKTIMDARIELGKEMVPVLEKVMGIVQVADGADGPQFISTGIRDLATAIRQNQADIVDFFRIMLQVIRFVGHIGKAFLDIRDSFNAFEASLRSMMDALTAGAAWINTKVDESLSFLAKLVTFGKSNFVSTWFDQLAEKSRKAFKESAEGMKMWWETAQEYRNRIQGRGTMGTGDIDTPKKDTTPRLPGVVVSEPEIRSAPPIIVVGDKNPPKPSSLDDADDIDTEKKKRAVDVAREKMESAMEALRSSVAQTTSGVEDNLIASFEKLKDKIADAVREAKKLEVFDPKLQKEIDEALPKIEVYARDMQGVQDAEKLGKKLGGFDNKDILDPSQRALFNKAQIDAQWEYIDYLEAQRANVEKNSTAWEKYGEMIQKALDAMSEFGEEESKNANKGDEDARQIYEDRVQRMTGIMNAAAGQITSVWGTAWDNITNGARVMNEIVNAIGRSISSALVAAGAEWAMQKSQENFILAAEETAKGIGALASGNPGAAGHFSAALKHAAVGAAWAALAGAGGGLAASASRGGGGTRKDNTGAAKETKPNTMGPEINIYLDGFDPKNPRHSRLLRDGIREVREKYGNDSIVRMK